MPPVDSDKTIVLEDPAKLVASPESTTPPETIPLVVGDVGDVGAAGSGTDNDSLSAPAPLTLDVKPAQGPSSPKLTISPAPPTNPTPVSGDIILPLMIFAVVKTNPPHLVSHLLYTQRFRYQAIGGEESYCLINLLAVAEFLENVDLAALGLGEKEKTVLRYVLVVCVSFCFLCSHLALHLPHVGVHTSARQDNAPPPCLLIFICTSASCIYIRVSGRVWTY